MSSWETELERVPLQALPTGRQWQSQELNPWLPRPGLAAEPQDRSSPLPAIAPSWGPASSLLYQNPTGRVDFQNIPARKTEAMLGLVSVAQKVLSLPLKTIFLCHACWQTPRKLQLLQPSKYQLSFSDTKNPGSPVSFILYKDSSCTTKKRNHPISSAQWEKEHPSPSGGQCTGGAMGSWNARYPGQESIKLGKSIKKSFHQQSPCVLFGSQQPCWSAQVQWQELILWLNSSGDGFLMYTSEQCLLCPKSFRNLTGVKKIKNTYHHV